jgi:hypothetical protein
MWRKVMARPPKLRSDLELEVPRVDSTIRPPPPRANSDDLELEDDAATTVLPLRWPEPPKDLAERLQGVRTDGVGLSRSVAASARPRWGWLWRSFGVAVIVGAMLRVVPLRVHRAAKPAMTPSPAPAAAPAVRAAMLPPPVPQPPAPPPAAPPLESIAATARPAPTKPPIDISSLPKAAPISAPSRPAPKRIVKPAVRAPVPPPAPDPGTETASHVDENAYDAPPSAKCRTCDKGDNPY